MCLFVAGVAQAAGPAEPRSPGRGRAAAAPALIPPSDRHVVSTSRDAVSSVWSPLEPSYVAFMVALYALRFHIGAFGLCPWTHSSPFQDILVAANFSWIWSPWAERCPEWGWSRELNFQVVAK